MQSLARRLLALFGWRLKITYPPYRQFVLIGAPHTSNWDFPLALLAFWTLPARVKWVAKKSLFRQPLGSLMRALGGIPVDRSRSQGFTRKVTEAFERNRDMVLCIAPEGTRSRTEYWKSGFYYIALDARVPICLGYIDYARKELGFEKCISPSGDLEADMRVIAEYYRDIQGLYPHKQGPVRIRPRTSVRRAS